MVGQLPFPTGHSQNSNESPHAVSPARQLSRDSKASQYASAKATLATFKKPAHWVIVFGAFLATCAGIVDAVGYQVFGALITNMTGTTASIGMHLQGYHVGDSTAFDLGRATLIIMSFIGGAFLCGLLIDKNQVHFGGKSAYGLALIGNSVLLVGATFLSSTALFPATCMAAAASGLQNAMCTSHFGAVVRTTHVTGTVTDIGSTMGRMVMIVLKRRCRCSQLNVVERAELEVDRKKLMVLLPLFFSFLGGCIVGTYVEHGIGRYALLVPAGFTGIAGMVYLFFRQYLKESIKAGELKRAWKDLNEVNLSLGRLHTVLHEMRHRPAVKSGEGLEAGVQMDRAPTMEQAAVVDLDDELEHAIEVMHDLEATVEELRSESDAAESVPRPSSEMRTESGHSLWWPARESRV